jgi:hypothetical protein
MLHWFIKRKLKNFERQYDYDMSYVHDMVDTDLGAAMRFSKLEGMTSYRKDVPMDAWFAAKIAATLHEDCGPCTQLVVNMAEQAGVHPKTLRAILAGDSNEMGEAASLGYTFAQAVMAHDLAANSLREQVLARWGKRALLSLAFGIATSRLYPTIKYATGHGLACVRVSVNGQETKVSRAPYDQPLAA